MAIVLEKSFSIEKEIIRLSDSIDKFLACSIKADRDFPAFDRVTKDGIAIKYKSIQRECILFDISGVQYAGMKPMKLKKKNEAIEIMTGAVLPINSDTIIPYEDIEITRKDNIAQLMIKKSSIKKGQFIHRKGSDALEKSVILSKGTIIKNNVLPLLASIGKTKVKVFKIPRMCIVSTGDELVPINNKPLFYQLRSSNAYAIKKRLEKDSIESDIIHIEDNFKAIKRKLKKNIDEI